MQNPAPTTLGMTSNPFTISRRFFQVRAEFICRTIECMEWARRSDNDSLNKILGITQSLSRDIPILFLIPEILESDKMPKCFPNRINRIQSILDNSLIPSLQRLSSVLPHSHLLYDLFTLLYLQVSRVSIGTDDREWAIEAHRLLNLFSRRIDLLGLKYSHHPPVSEMVDSLCAGIRYKDFSCNCCLCLCNQGNQGNQDSQGLEVGAS